MFGSFHVGKFGVCTYHVERPKCATLFVHHTPSAGEKLILRLTGLTRGAGFRSALRMRYCYPHYPNIANIMTIYGVVPLLQYL